MLQHAATAMVLQLAIADPHGLQQRLTGSPGSWHGLLNLLHRSPWLVERTLGPPLPVQDLSGWQWMPLAPHRFMLSQHRSFWAPPPHAQPEGQVHDSHAQPDAGSHQGSGGLNASRPEIQPSCHPSKRQHQQQRDDALSQDQPHRMQHAENQTNMHLHEQTMHPLGTATNIAQIILRLLAGADMANGAQGRSNALASSEPGHHDQADDSDGSNQHPPTELQSLAAPLLEGLMAALAAAAVHLLSTPAAGCASSHTGQTLVQAAEHQQQQAALHCQAKTTLTACSQAAASVLAGAPHLRSAQVAFAVSCSQLPAARSRPGRSPIRQPVHAVQTPSNMSAAATFQMQARDQVPAASHDADDQWPGSSGCEQPGDGLASHRRCLLPGRPSEHDHSQHASLNGSLEPGQPAPHGVLMLVGQLLQQERQRCPQSSRVALCRLLANLFVTQDMADALLDEPAGALTSKHLYLRKKISFAGCSCDTDVGVRPSGLERFRSGV